MRLNERSQVDPKLSKRKDDDGRLPIHWAASANQLDIVQLLAEQNGFDVDVQVRPPAVPLCLGARPWAHPHPPFVRASFGVLRRLPQDDMGWTPLMIAASVKDSEKLVQFLLSKGADPNEKSTKISPAPSRPPPCPYRTNQHEPHPSQLTTSI